jgi:hypothetical protein
MVAQGIFAELENIRNPLLRSTLNELAKDIRSAPRGGQGDAYYYVEMLNEQKKVFVRVAQKLESIIKVVEDSRRIQNPHEGGAMSCLKVF